MKIQAVGRKIGGVGRKITDNTGGAPCCCGGGGDRPCFCGPMVLRSHCGCGTDVVGCCECPGSFVLVVNHTISYSSEQVVTYFGPGGPITSRGVATYTRTYSYRETRRCVDGHPQSSFDGSTFHMEYHATGQPAQIIDATDFEVTSYVGGVHQRHFACGFPSPDVFRTFASGSGDCCSGGQSGSGSCSNGEFVGGQLCCSNSPGGTCHREWSFSDSWNGGIACDGGHFDEAVDQTASSNGTDGFGGGYSTSRRFNAQGHATWQLIPLETCAVDPCDNVVPTPIGACCASVVIPNGIDDQQCSMRTKTECNRLGRLYQGDGIFCDHKPCIPLGACCEPSGRCVLTTAFGCVQRGGSFHGNGTDCRVNPCPPPNTGACCANGTCIGSVTETACLAGGGNYLGNGVACLGVQCPATNPDGACCLNGVCSIHSESDCLLKAGKFMGEGSNCQGPICPGTGACCVSSPFGPVCQQHTGTNCASLGGVFKGIGVGCTQATCVPDSTGVPGGVPPIRALEDFF